MASLGFWGILKLLFQLLPEIIALIKAAVVWVDGKVDAEATKAKMKRLSAAIDRAQETGDTSDVEAIFNPKP